MGGECRALPNWDDSVAELGLPGNFLLSESQWFERVCFVYPVSLGL